MQAWNVDEIIEQTKKKKAELLLNVYMLQVKSGLLIVVIECVIEFPLTLIENNSAGMPMIMEVMLKMVHRIKNITVTAR